LLLTTTALVLLAGCGATEAPVSPTSTPTAAIANTALVTYKGHSAGVGYLAWSPDGKRIATASADKTTQIWDAATGSHFLTYSGHASIVDTVAWSPDGSKIVTGAGYPPGTPADEARAQVWDAATGKTLLTYRGHTQYINVAVWSPDGKQIASSSADGTVQV
jgi:WD40 repeat protein